MVTVLNEVDKEINKMMLKKLTCTFCGRKCYPKIFSCDEMHIYCRGCIPDDNMCRKCNTIMRHVPLLDNVASLLQYPCHYGCETTLKAAEIYDHEAKVCTKHSTKQSKDAPSTSGGSSTPKKKKK